MKSSYSVSTFQLGRKLITRLIEMLRLGLLVIQMATHGVTEDNAQN